MTKLAMLNYFVLQWFFIRLCRVKNNDGDQVGWGLMFGIYPLSGWENSYKYTKWYRFWHYL